MYFLTDTHPPQTIFLPFPCHILLQYDFNVEGLLSNLTFSDVCVQSISGRAIDVAVKTLMSDTMFFVSHKSNLSKKYFCSFLSTKYEENKARQAPTPI